MERSVILKKTTLAHIISYCMKNKPYEACGLLLGSFDEVAQAIHVEQFLPVPNIAQDAATHFMMDPAAIIPIVTKPSPMAESIVGVLHSHPTSAPIPSAEDLQSAWLHIPSHWIVSLQLEEHYDIKAFHYYKKAPNQLSQKVDYTSLPIIISHN
jgi:proteasome lid subunit RPN8/RPN11